MFFISYWILPLLSALTWLAMLAAMLGKWLADGSPHYPSMSPDQHIAYISDVGAAAPAPNRSGLKPLFIAMSSVTVVLLDLAFFADRWLRHRGRLAPNTTTSEKVLSVIASIFAIAGAAGIILLSIFDTYNYPHAHDGFLLLFIGGYVIAAIFICAEYQRLGVHQRQHRILAISFWIKLAFIIVEVALAIGFVVENFRGNKNDAAVLEWVIALIFTFWVLSFFIDLLPAVKTKDGNGGDGFDQVEFGRPGGPYVVRDKEEFPRGTMYSGSTQGADENTGASNQPKYPGDGSRGNYGGYRGTGATSPGPNNTMTSSTSGGDTWVDQRTGQHAPGQAF